MVPDEPQVQFIHVPGAVIAIVVIPTETRSERTIWPTFNITAGAGMDAEGVAETILQKIRTLEDAGR